MSVGYNIKEGEETKKGEKVKDKSLKNLDTGKLLQKGLVQAKQINRKKSSKILGKRGFAKSSVGVDTPKSSRKRMKTLESKKGD